MVVSLLLTTLRNVLRSGKQNEICVTSSIWETPLGHPGKPENMEDASKTVFKGVKYYIVGSVCEKVRHLCCFVLFAVRFVEH